SRIVKLFARLVNQFFTQLGSGNCKYFARQRLEAENWFQIVISYDNGNGNVNGNDNFNVNVNDNIRPLAPSNLEGELKIENDNGNGNVKKSETSVASV
ncbi:MAG: hypothetical protein J5918_08445, partial [Prevotella sp.]|nr:hypothetical protein [Prevotella sp.]